MLKAITLWEPWASLMAIGAKKNETRGCWTKHRGDIAIHALNVAVWALLAWKERNRPT